MIKGVLFDMDGVLFNTEHLSIAAENKAKKQMGVTFPEGMHEKFIGGSDEFAIATIDAHFKGEISGAEFMGLFHKLWAQEVEQNLAKMPGVDETLGWLKENGYSVAVASSSTVAHIQRNLGMTGLENTFDTIVGGDMVENGKPAPDIFIKAAGALGLAPHECAAVEDSFNGVRSASAAGCTTVMVPDVLAPTDEMRTLAAAVLESLHELPDFLREMQVI